MKRRYIYFVHILIQCKKSGLSLALSRPEILNGPDFKSKNLIFLYEPQYSKMIFFGLHI